MFQTKMTIEKPQYDSTKKLVQAITYVTLIETNEPDIDISCARIKNIYKNSNKVLSWRNNN